MSRDCLRAATLHPHLPLSITSNLRPRIPSLYPTTTLYILNMAGKAKLTTKKTQLQQAVHDHVMDIAIAEYHVDGDLGHLKPPRGFRRMTGRTKTMTMRPG
jgi:hypothetical protein